jgi:hypothetical protein
VFTASLRPAARRARCSALCRRCITACSLSEFRTPRPRCSRRGPEARRTAPRIRDALEHRVVEGRNGGREGPGARVARIAVQLGAKA